MSERELLALLNCNGINTAKALSCFSNDVTFYINVFKSFLNSNTSRLVEHSLINSDYKAAIMHADDLRSITGFLGMEQEHRSSSDLCIHIKAKKYIEAKSDIAKIRANYSNLFDIIHQYKKI